MSSEIETTGEPMASTAAPARTPLRGWSLELARRWNAGVSTLFVLHGNIFDVFPTPGATGPTYAPLKTFLTRRLFPERGWLLFYDIGDGLTFGSAEMQQRFFEWLEIFDRVEGTNFRETGPPREFTRLTPLLRRFFSARKRPMQIVRASRLSSIFPRRSSLPRKNRERVSMSGWRS
jgi:hypothetical protein